MATASAATVRTLELRDLLDSATSPRLVDVRTPGEFATAHIRGALNVPLDLLREHREEVCSLLGRDVVLICRSGQRATQADDILRAAGRVDVRVLDGGMIAWEGARLAVDRGAVRWDLERQVRLIAGSIVLSSVLVSLVVPRLKWLAAAVGGGLIFAAATDTCAMGMLLAKLPYNRGELQSVLSGLRGDSSGRTAA